jgi:hypothetical protein
MGLNGKVDGDRALAAAAFLDTYGYRLHGGIHIFVFYIT